MSRGTRIGLICLWFIALCFGLDVHAAVWGRIDFATRTHYHPLYIACMLDCVQVASHMAHWCAVQPCGTYQTPIGSDRAHHRNCQYFVTPDPPFSAHYTVSRRLRSADLRLPRLAIRDRCSTPVQVFGYEVFATPYPTINIPRFYGNASPT